MSLIMEESLAFTDADAPRMLIHAAKANQVCAGVRKMFNTCRATPFGRVVDPHVCSNLAKDLITCFHDVSRVPAACAEDFTEVLGCVERRQSKEGLFAVAMCEGVMRNYANCEDPATAKWAQYS